MICRTVVVVSGFAFIFGQPAIALEPASSSPSIDLHGAVTYGTAIRTTDRDPALMTPGNAAAIGATGTATAGRNSDDGNLNFAKHDAISTVLKGVGSAEVKAGSAGGLVRAKFWHDYALADENRPWGNTINQYQRNTPLSDNGLEDRAQFSGWALQDAYVYGQSSALGLPIDARLGQQTIPWGRGWQILGGLSMLTPLDLPAINRPGALPEESVVPFPAAFARFTLSSQARVEGFYQIRFRPSELNGCGTFFSTQDYNAPGCNRVLLAGANDQVGLATGMYGKRADTPSVSNDGQFGVGGAYALEDGSEFGAYAARYHSRWLYTGAVRTTRTTIPFVPGDPDGKNAQYITEYPEDITIYALTWKTAPTGFNGAAELSYSPNQPVQLNATDLLNAFSSNTAASVLRGDVAGTPLGAVYHGFDRMRVAQLLAASGYSTPQALGGINLNIRLEIGVKHVFDLPDPSVRRYGRSDMYGIGPVNGACTGSASQCSMDGYVTANAWGYRLRASITYPEVLPQLDITPSVSWGEDVKGWSYDSVFNEGRRVGAFAVRATYRKAFWAMLSWNPISGGTYNNMRDRSYATAMVGMRF